MEISLLSAVRNHPDTPYDLADVYDDYISDAVLAEELGFARAWFGEHHFRPCQWIASPLIFATAVAARTERIRVGTSVALMPFHDPRRLAEDLAIADQLSHGRVDFGFGPGSQYEEFKSFGVDPSEMNTRTWESVDWITRAFTENGPFSHKGKHYDIPDMTFTTKPAQDPLPFWYGGFGPKNTARAAKRGFNLIAPVNFGYDDLLVAEGRTPADYAVSSMQMVCVADTTDEAFEAAGPGLEYALNFYTTRKNLKGEYPETADIITTDRLRAKDTGMWSGAIGTPDEVIESLRPVMAGKLGRVTELACAFRHAGQSTESAHKSMRLFHDHVMPALREEFPDA